MRGALNRYHTSAVFLQELSPIIRRILHVKMPDYFNSNFIDRLTMKIHGCGLRTPQNVIRDQN